MTTVVTRFAPSPTGYLHAGNFRTAVLNWMAARAADGRFLLRLDDTDRERSTEEFAAAIEYDLAWTGLIYDDMTRQSDRLDRYAEAMARLKAAGRLYPAYETPEELERRRRLQRARGLPPVYDRAALKLSDDDRARLEAEGRAPHWRFLLDRRVVAWDDGVRGRQTVDAAALSDPVLARGDGTVLYTLASVVDDVEMGVTDVIRGEDHVANTAVQIQIFEALGAPPPRFAHHALLVAADGGPLSKREGAASIRDLRARGLDPMTVLSYLATLGTSGPVTLKQSAGELIDMFDLSTLSRAPARFDTDELLKLNAAFLRDVLFGVVKGRLARLGVSGPAAEPFWNLIRENVTTLDEAADWWPIVAGEVDPAADPADAGFLADAADLLPEAPWDEGVWKRWTNAAKMRSGRRGAALFLPLRRALTGRDHGPELAQLLPLIGRETALKRLRAAAAAG